MRDECRAIELRNCLRIDDLSRSRDLTNPNPRTFRRGYYQLGVHEIGGGTSSPAGEGGNWKLESSLAVQDAGIHHRYIKPKNVKRWRLSTDPVRQR